MRTTILITGFLVNSAVWWLLWHNRASEKVVTAAVAALITVTVTTAAAVVFSANEPMYEHFVAAFPVKSDGSKEMVFLRTRNASSAFQQMSLMMANHAIDTLRKRDPTFVDNAQDFLGQDLYHHLLQRALVEWMAIGFRNSWKVERHEFEIPGAGGHSITQGPLGVATSGDTIRAIDFAQLLRGNKFFDIPVGSEGFVVQITLPPNTKMVTRPPTASVGSQSEIKLQNSFCEVMITTSRNGGSRGLGQYKSFDEWDDWRGYWKNGLIKHAYRPTKPIPWDKEVAGFLTYNVVASANFSQLRAGHPDMPAYRSWAREFIRLLRLDWDEQGIFDRTKARISTERLME